MSGLTQSSCVPCRGDAPPLTTEEIARLLPEAPGWGVVEREGIPRLEREFSFGDFRDALGFAVRVGMLAEREDHHPDLLVAWGRVRVEVWTHKIRGLHRNDFILAAKAGDLYAGKKAG